MKPILLACAALSVALPHPARAVELVPFWEEQRQTFIALSAKACAGDSTALSRIKWHIAEEGNPVAMNSYAWMMRQEGCPGYGADEATRVNVFRRSAELGYPVGANNYAISLMKGDGGEKDWDLALSFFVTAFEGGYHDAATTLATEYARGVHVERNLLEAMYWLRNAERAGMDPASLAEAQEAIAEAQEDVGAAAGYGGFELLDDDGFDLWIGSLGRGD